jgi:uncharacterized protein (TIGR02996 family)
VEDEAAVAALFAEVYARPDDDQVRLVLADALITRGDPRGELIQLQLQPEADHARRTMSLLQQHGLSWLGALRGVVVPLAYERGFLASCLVVARLSFARMAPEWGTVHTIELTPEALRFEVTPAMRALRRLVNPTPNQLLEIANAGGLAAVTVEASYGNLFDDMLARFLPVNAIGTLLLDAVPADRVDRVRALASRHDKMTLRVRALPPPVRYDDTDE